MKAIILAAGKGTRMYSNTSKVLHRIGGKTLLQWVLDSIDTIEVKDTYIVVGHQAEAVISSLSNEYHTVLQKEQKGTGDAVKKVLEQMGAIVNMKDDNVIVLCGDTPLVTKEAVKEIIETHNALNNDMTVVGAIAPDPTGYGRIITDNSGKVHGIVEQKDANEQQVAIKLINTGIYVFSLKKLAQIAPQFEIHENTGEYYLTDTVELFNNHNYKVGYTTIDYTMSAGINNREQLNYADQIIQEKIKTDLMKKGVTMRNPTSIYIDATVDIDNDVELLPGVMITGRSKIGRGSKIGPNTQIKDTQIGEYNRIISSTIKKSKIGDHNNIGPNAHIRDNADIRSHCRIGNFVEIKNSVLNDGAKAAHLSYIGDATVGARSNIGAGTITCNYDGVNKSKTIIGEDCFIGSNSIIVAPVTIADRSVTAAGSVITEDIKTGQLAIARAPQINKDGYYEKKFGGKIK